MSDLIKDKEPDITRLKDTQTVNEAVLQEKLDVTLKQLAEKQFEIERLQDQLNAVYKAAGSDEAMIGELEKSRLVNRALTLETEQRTNRIIELEGNLEISTRELNRVRIALDDIEGAYLKEQELKNQLQNQMDAINKKSQASFEMADISKYLTGVINEFNEAVNTGDAAVNYIIRGLDVEMKAHIAKTEDNRLLMSAPSLSSTSEESLSVIKFSIAAAPKDMASYD
jgi:uncharacterized coiled-coil protein SlyX